MNKISTGKRKNEQWLNLSDTAQRGQGADASWWAKSATCLKEAKLRRLNDEEKELNAEEREAREKQQKKKKAKKDEQQAASSEPQKKDDDNDGTHLDIYVWPSDYPKTLVFLLPHRRDSIGIQVANPGWFLTWWLQPQLTSHDSHRY